MAGKWSRYARAHIDTYIINHRLRIGASGEQKMSVPPAKPLHGQHVQDMLGSARENPKSRESQHGERKMGLQRF